MFKQILMRAVQNKGAFAAAHAIKPIIPIQQRFVHKRGYNDFYDVPFHTFHEVNAGL